MAAVWRSQSVFTRFFTRKTIKFLNNSTDYGARLTPDKFSISAAKNYSNFAHSPFVDKIKEQYEFEIVKNPPEWKYVERLLPFETIPKVTSKESYPSGWVPPNEDAINHPYFLSRTKNHMLPIYLMHKNRGAQKITVIKRIEGDIWLLNDEIKQVLKTKNNRYVETRVHEFGNFIQVKGDFVNDVTEWALSKGF